MTITLHMDDKEITVEEGKTLLEVGREQGIDIPTICFHEATTANALCRICVVEIEGMRLLQPACIVQAAANMKVQTRSERVDRARKTILEMLASTLDLSEAEDIQAMMREYEVDVDRFPDAFGVHQVFDRPVVVCSGALRPNLDGLPPDDQTGLRCV